MADFILKKVMKLKIAKKPKGKTYSLTEGQLHRIKKEVTDEATSMAMLLYLAALAEKGWTEEALVNLFEEVNRYAAYIDNHIVKVREIQRIIENKTGMKLKGKW